MADARRVIRIDVVTSPDARRAVRDLNKRLREIEGNSAKAAKSIRGMGRNINFMTAAAKAYVAIRFGQVITQMADDMILLSARVKLVADETVGLNEAMDDLFDLSRETRSSIDATGTLYARLGLATQELGFSHQNLLDVVQTVANTLLLSGATAQESSSSMIQLSQAFAKGRLDGDEFRNMTEANVVMFDLLAEKLNVTKGELFEMSKAGQLTTERILPALANAADETQAKVDQMGFTFGQAAQMIRNEFYELMVELGPEIKAVTESIVELIRTFRQTIQGIRLMDEWTDAWLDGQISTWEFLTTNIDQYEKRLRELSGAPLEIKIEGGTDLPIPPPPPTRGQAKRPGAPARDPLEEFRKGLLETQAELQRLPEYVAILDELMLEGAISTDLWNQELQKLTGTVSDMEPVVDDWSEAMKNAIAKSTVDAIGDMTDAFVDFALTGKQSFAELTSSILADISKLILQMVVLNSLKSAFADTPIGNFLFPTGTRYATGTPYVPQDGLAYLHKGERVVPASQNTVTNNNNYTTERPISIVNVTDPNQVNEIMSGAMGEELVINHIRRNPDLIRQVLA